MLKSDRIFGNYEIVATLGRGAMGVVYKARHLTMDNLVAIKTLHVDTSNDFNAIERLKREAVAASQLNHPSIVKPLLFSTQKGTPFIVYEYIEGDPLSRILDERTILPNERVISIVAQLASALDQAHCNGIVHRDVKPSNVLIDVSGTPRLLDFGIAAVKNIDGRLTATNQILGTPAYMSPEQWRGITPDGRSDLYSLGCIMYQMLTGTVPFCGENSFDVGFKHLNETPDIVLCPTALASVCARLLSKSPEDRFQTGKELIDALNDCNLEVQSLVDGTRVHRSRWMILLPLVLCGAVAYVSPRMSTTKSPSNSTRKKNFTTEAVLINQIYKCLGQGNVSGAHKLFAGRARSCTAAMIQPLNQLCLSEESMHSHDALTDIRDLELLIEKTEGSDSPRIFPILYRKGIMELLLRCTSNATAKRLKESQVAISTGQIASQQEIGLLITSLIPRYEIELMNSEQMTALQRRMRLMRLRQDLNKSKKEAKRKYESSVVVREFALSSMHLAIALNDEREQTLYGNELLQHYKLLWQLRKHQLGSPAVFLLLTQLSTCSLLPTTRADLVTFVNGAVKAEPDVAVSVRLRCELARFLKSRDPTKSLQTLKETLHTPEFVEYHLDWKAQIYHQILSLKSNIPRSERIALARAAYTCGANTDYPHTWDSRITIPHVLANELSAAGQYRQAISYFDESLKYAIKGRNEETLATVALQYAIEARKHKDEERRKLALRHCSFLTGSRDPKLQEQLKEYTKQLTSH